MGEKADLVAAHRAQYGVNTCLFALEKGIGHRRQHRSSQQQRDAELKKEVVVVIMEHPEYGYRRIQHEIAERLGQRINAKRMRRVLAVHDLQRKRSIAQAPEHPVRKAVNLAGSAANRLRKPRFAPLEVCSTGFTEIVYVRGQRKASLMVLLCIATRWVGGCPLHRSAIPPLRCAAWTGCTRTSHGLGASWLSAFIHHDKDAVYTGYAWLKRMRLKEDTVVSYAQHGAKDHPWIESFWGRFKSHARRWLGAAARNQSARV